ncbi:MAG: type II toxin-antitoxin system PemK/MazF family toxin [Proteobacteria bacterium]|nr:type II toxin-antitoxin system PemK/MazF family toxin [Pseudomonadota bacterium]
MYKIDDKLDTIQGVVLCDQIRSIDWSDCDAKFIGILSEITLSDILAKLTVLLN